MRPDPDLTAYGGALKPVMFRRFEDAYLAVLAHVSHEFEYVNAPRANAAHECLNVSFALADPRDRIVSLPQRRTNIVFCFAEALWYLWGRDDLEMIGYYAPRIATVSADGVHLTGTAYGPKLFRADDGGGSQWDRVLSLLAEDPCSKRAVIAFFHPCELADTANPDVSCAVALQLLLRAGRLHAVVSMRGNDAVTGLLCDTFSFTLIQEFTAGQLGVEVGTYTHHVASMHINDADLTRADRIAAAGPAVSGFPVMAMPPTNWKDLRTLEGYEEALRRNDHRIAVAELGSLGLDPYWQQVLLLFEVYRQIVHEPSSWVAAEVLRALTPAYRWLVAHRWPRRVPDGSLPAAPVEQAR